MAPAKDKWISRFIIPETRRHKKGFTIYKVTSMVFLNSSHEEISKVSVWKRYNDFKKLHSELSKLHKKLGIKESFPTFPKSKYFGRFETEVVEERRKYALKFLEFVGRYSYLYSSDIFITFFETNNIDHTSDCAHSLSSDTSEDDRIVALNSVLTNDSTAQDVSQAPCPSKTSHNVSSNLCSTLSNIYTNKKEFTVSQKNNESHSTTNLQNASIEKNEQTYKTVKQYAQDAITKDCDAHIKNKNLDKNKIKILSNESGFDSLNNNINKDLSKCNTVNSVCSSTLDEKMNISQTQPDSTQYILIAAGHMSAAFRHESMAEYEEAFTQYKLGISCLITGVQFDADHTRAASIKDKISKYLTRAEELYHRHLDCNISLVSKPVSELQYYKVLKIMKSVMLAMDIRGNCNRIIKTIEKSSVHEDNISNYVLHGCVPYMVNLYACIETDTSVFLILQYASCGKLWDFIKLHFETSNNLYNNAVSNNICVNNQVNKELNSNDKTHDINKTDEIVKNNISQGEDYLCVTDIQNENYTMELPTTQLLEKSQKLLQSVNATLKRSNSIASRLNKFKDLRQSENIPNGKTVTRISQDSDLYYNKSSNSDINVDDNTVGKNLSIKNFANNKDVKSTNTLSIDNSKNVSASVLNGNCTTLNLSEKASDPLYTIRNISTNNMIHTCKNKNIVTNSTNINYSTNVNSNLTFKSHKNYDHETENPYLYKENVDEEQVLWQVPENIIRSWAAEILSALEALHRQNVLIIDFKPDNILLDDTGHIRLTYIVPQRDIELSKLTYPYSSPESTTFSPTILVTSATDIWSFGIILYELLTGIIFTIKHPGLFHSHSTLDIPNNLSENAKSLLYGMLRYYPDDRLPIEEIKRHPFFAGIDWSNMINSQT